MSASDTFASPIHEDIEGVGKVTFSRLLSVEYGEIEQIVHQTLIDYHTKLLNLCGVKGEQMYFALTKSVPEQITINDVFNWCNSVSGMREVLTRSLAKSATDSTLASSAVTYYMVKAHMLDRNNLINAVLGIGPRRKLADILAEIKKRKDELNKKADEDFLKGSAEQSTGPESTDSPSEQDAQTQAA